MKRITWWAALATLATFVTAGQVEAQTRVAVVNIGTVFSKYKKAENFKAEMEATLKPYKDQAEQIKKSILEHQEGLKKLNPTDTKLREQYENNLRILRRQLEDIDLEARKKIGKRQEEHLVQLYKEVNDHIKAVAQTNGIHIVLGFGEPPGDLLNIKNIERKLTAMDMGGVVPLFFHESLDISETVVLSLNRSYGAVTPTSLQK